MSNLCNQYFFQNVSNPPAVVLTNDLNDVQNNWCRQLKSMALHNKENREQWYNNTDEKEGEERKWKEKNKCRQLETTWGFPDHHQHFA